MSTDARQVKFIIALVAAALLLACGQNVGPDRVHRDVTKAQTDGERIVMEAQAYLDLVNSQYSSEVVNARVRARNHDPRNASTAATNNADALRLRIEAKQKIADALYGIDKAKAEASYNVAKAQCEGYARAASKSCIDDATTSYAAEMAAAKSRKVAVHLAATN